MPLLKDSKLIKAFHASVRFRFLTLFAVALLLPLLTLAIWSYQFLTEANLISAYQSQLDQLSYIDLWISTQLRSRPEEIMSLLLKQDAVLTSDTSLRKYTSLPTTEELSIKELALRDTFQNFKENYSDLAFVFLGLEDGSYVEYPPLKLTKPYNPTERPWYVNTVKEGVFKIGNPYYSSITNQLVISITQPITVSGGTKGVLGFTMEISDIADNIGRNILFSKNHFILINPEGVVVVSPKQTDWIAQPARAILPPHFVEALDFLESKPLATRRKSSPPRHSQFMDFIYPGQQDVNSALLFTMPTSDWKILSITDKSELTKQNRQLMTLYMSAFAATISLSTAIIWVYIGKITKPLELIGETIRSENYLHPKEMQKILKFQSRTDEIGLISHSVVQLINSRNLIASNQARLSVATQLTTQALFDYSIDEDLLYINPSMSALLNLRSQISLFHLDPLWEKIHIHHLSLLKDALRRLINGSDKKIEIAFQLHEDLHNPKWYLLRSESFSSPESDVIERVIGVIIDVDHHTQQIITLEETNSDLERQVSIRTTELTALNEELQATNEDLENAMTFIRDKQEDIIRTEKLHTMGILVSGVAHEVNTPLGISITLSSFLTEQLEHISKHYEAGQLSRGDFTTFMKETKDSLGMLQINLDKTSQLIESLRILNKSDFEDVSLPFTVGSALDDLIFSLTPTLEKSNITITTLVNTEEHFWGALQHFNQIITNLVVNSTKHAFHHSDSNHHIAIRIDREGSFLNIYYSDNGIGIPDDIAKHIYDPFYTTARGRGGTGLGLYLVYNLVTINFKGSIAYKRLHPNGSSFIIQLKSKDPYLNAE